MAAPSPSSSTAPTQSSQSSDTQAAPSYTLTSAPLPTPLPAQELATSPPLSTTAFRSARPSVVGPEGGPMSPFPLALRGAVQRGFGRGGKDLGCPTANLPDDALRPLSAATTTGIYFGFAQVLPDVSTSEAASGESKAVLGAEDRGVYPMAMSLGWNPFYKNERLSAEVHIMHDFASDFYGHEMRVLLLGYIRPELDYTSREALIDDIETDKKVALASLARPGYVRYVKDPLFDLSSI